MPKSPSREWSHRNVRAEEFDYADQPNFIELTVRGGGRLTVLPHELGYLEALIAEIRATRGIPVLALAKRGTA